MLKICQEHRENIAKWKKTIKRICGVHFPNKGIEKLGKAGETVKVAPRYFKKQLMPKLRIVPNIDKYAYLILEQRKEFNIGKFELVEAENKKIIQEYEKKKQQMDVKRMM